MTAPAWAASAGARALVFADHPGSGADGRVRIDGPDGHHLQRVRRLEIGERIVVADGVGGWYEAGVVGVSDGVIDGERLGPDRIEPVVYRGGNSEPYRQRRPFRRRRYVT